MRQNNDGRITWHKVKGHFKTITEHKLLVMKHCFRSGLYRQGLMHDLDGTAPFRRMHRLTYGASGLKPRR